MLPSSFFQLPALALAPALLGKVLCRLWNDELRKCRIIETEAYTLADKASHAYRKRKGCEPMFDAPGTIYMYRIRQWDSLNISALGKGCGVLIKSAVPYFDRLSSIRWLRPYGSVRRALGGQGLLCRALQLRTDEWNGKQFCNRFYLEDGNYQPQEILVTPRLGVTANKEHPYRFVDGSFIRSATLSHIKARWKEKGLSNYYVEPLQAVHFCSASRKTNAPKSS